MPTVTLIADPAGKLAGLTDKDERAYQQFVRRIRELGRSCITFEWREPRSGPAHRRFFAMIHAAFDAQERFDDVEQFRAWLQIGAGFAEFLPHPERGLVAVPKSIAFAKLDDVEFRAVADKVWAFYRSEHARQTLWPHLGDAESAEMVWTILEEFE